MSIPSKQISRIYLVFHIIQHGIIPVCDYTAAFFLEFLEVVDDFGTKECAPVFKGGLVDYNCGSFGFDTLHDTLDRTLAEVVRVGFHGKTVNANYDLFLLLFFIL